MATCTQRFYAVDKDGNYPAEVDPEIIIKKWTGSEYVKVGAFPIWVGGRGITLEQGVTHTAQGLVPVGVEDDWELPKLITFIPCQKDITVAWRRICPDPTVSITSVSNSNPASGEVVNFEGYASGGTGHTIVSKKWDFGDGTSSTALNPSKSWTNTTGLSKTYTVKFTATNDCLASKSTSMTITVASEAVKTGIEIQFPASMNGKQLIAHGAISTVLDMWWTGPAVHGVLWTKGRCTWDNIDSTKKYVIQTGDACETSLPRETPSVCAGTFIDDDDVVILVRNPGFDFRVYGSGNVHKLSGTSFGVLYLDTTSGDIIDEMFTGKVCGWLGIPSGTECDAFWAEFYDPIFVANYMSIQSTGVDMFGNAKTLSWIDHVAFVASLIGSLPILNIIPIGAVVTRIGTACKTIAKATLSLGVDEALKAGKALVDVCENAPDAIGRMSINEIAELRQALVKVYGDVIGNGYVDDALRASRGFVDKYGDILEEYTRGLVNTIDAHHISNIIEEGIDYPENVVSMFDKVPKDLKDLLIRNLETGGPWGDKTISYPLHNLLDRIHIAKQLPHATPDAINNMTREICKVQKKALSEVDPNVASNIAEESFELPFRRGKVIDDACGTRP